MNIQITDKSVIIEDGNKKEEKSKSESVSPGLRDILFFTDVVIKFDGRDYGNRKQCEKEAEKYSEIEDEDKKYFATVLASGDGWVAMEKVDFIHPAELCEDVENEAREILEYLRNTYALADLHTDNWGIRKETNEVVIFDYGVHAQ